MMKTPLALAALVVLFSCGNEDTYQSGAPGDACQPTTQGAAACQSKMCATVTCVNSSTNASFDVAACAGSDCANSACPGGSQCVAFPSYGSWCLPKSACSTGNPILEDSASAGASSGGASNESDESASSSYGGSTSNGGSSSVSGPSEFGGSSSVTSSSEVGGTSSNSGEWSVGGSASTGTCQVLVRVAVCIDGSDWFHIQGTTGWFTHGSYDPAGTHTSCQGLGKLGVVTVNGTDVPLTWPNGSGQPSSTFMLPIAVPAVQGVLSPVVLQARGALSTTANPTSANSYEGILFIDDTTASEPAIYDFEVSWCPS